jgi:ferredoxin
MKAFLSSVRGWIRGFFDSGGKPDLNLTRRAVITAGLGGVGASLLFEVHPLRSARSFNPALIRPPGSVGENEFQTKCIRCGECMKVCPTNAVQPTLLEAGLAGLWSPVLNMRLGYCEYECTLCTQVCPTDAIRELDFEEKSKTKIGLATVDRNRCLPWAYARSCIVCEEHCPTPTKAIWFEEVEVLNEVGEYVLLKRPHVNPELCIGCGVCENKCPFRDKPAISVTSAGEVRNPDNEVLLTSGTDFYY